MSKDYNGSVAPKERINISYIPKTDGEPSEVELPLNMLIVGDTASATPSRQPPLSVAATVVYGHWPGGKR